MIKYLILIIFLTSCASTQPYLKIGAGYKFEETKIYWQNKGASTNSNHPISARFELGIEQENITYGISHHSQWLEGWPVNSNGEYSKTEVFADYKIRL